MIIGNLYERVLIDPAKEGGDELFIVSGYSSATFLKRHLKDILNINPEVKINLIKGIRGSSDHSAYLDILKEFSGSFDGYYYDGSPEVHSKTYSWIKNNSPSIGFSGSANYSQRGFSENEQQNQMTPDSAKEIKEYFLRLKLKSEKIQNYTPDESEVIQPINTGNPVLPGDGVWIEPNKSVRISLLTKRTEEIANRDSLNWGQRPGRERNQACLNIRGDAKTDGFLPPIAFTFTLLTDDGKAMDCTRQQQGGKAISTTYDNSEIGIYFRSRLNVQLGEFVKTEDLVKYGRTDFVLKKIDEETFYLDFSKPVGSIQQ